MPFKRLGDMSHAKRMAEIHKLQLALPKSKRPKVVPRLDSSTDRRVAPMSATPMVPFSSQVRSAAHHKDAIQFPSATTHKQGPQLITPGDIKTGRVHDFGGHKPNHNLTGGD